MRPNAKEKQHHNPDVSTERRVHRRMEIRLPVECRRDDEDASSIVRSISKNVSTGGLYLELDSADFQIGDRLRIELTLPPAEGVSPYPCRATSIAEVLRVKPIGTNVSNDPARFGVGARFLERLRITH